MKVLLLSNQGMAEPFVGNPIMLRLRDALLKDERIEEVKMLRCKKPFRVFSLLRKNAKEVDIIHLHFGGMYALLTWILLMGINKPKIITFHGTDIHAKAIKTTKSLKDKIKIKINQYASFISIMCYDKCGFVAEEMKQYLPLPFKKRLKDREYIHRLGVDYELFIPMDKDEAQKELGISKGKYLLFSDVNNTKIKRRDIAKSIADLLPGYQLLIMCGVLAKDVPTYINASECVLLTSDQEGSPNIIREALSLNKPVFSVEVGDAAKQLKGLGNSRIISRDPQHAAKEILESLHAPYKDMTRDTRKNILDMRECVNSVIYEYEKCLKR